MRAELNELERIDRYLDGDLSAEENAAFVERMKQDADFKRSVESQEQVRAYVVDRASRAMVSEAGASYFSKTSLFKPWMGIVAAILVSAVAGFALWPAGDSKPPMTQDAIGVMGVDERADPNPSALDQKVFELTPSVHTFNANEESIITDGRSGAVIVIPANALETSDGRPVRGEVDLAYQEFRDKADIVASNIPMTVEQDGEVMQFNSAGMFEIRASQQGEELRVKKGEEIRIDFEMTEKLPGTNFYQLNDNTKEWKMIKPDLEQDPKPQHPLKGQVTPVEEFLIVDGDTIGDFSEAEESVEWKAGNVQVVKATPFEDVMEAEEAAVIPIRNQNQWIVKYTPSFWGLFDYDTLQVLDSALNLGLGYTYLPRDEVFVHDYDFDNTLFNDRYESNKYCQTELRENRAGENLPVTLDVKGGKLEGKVELNLTYDIKEYPEMKAYQSVRIMYDADSHSIITPEMLGKSFLDMRMTFDRQTSTAWMELKSEYEFIKFPIFNHLEQRKQPSQSMLVKTTERKFEKYITLLQRREKLFNDKIQERIDAFGREESNNWKALYNASALFETNEVFELSYDDWQRHFRDAKSDMRAIYLNALDSLKKTNNPKQFIRNRFSRISKALENGNIDINAKGRKLLKTQVVVEQDFAWNVGPITTVREVDPNDRTQATLLGGFPGADAGRTYPDLVRQLNVSDFGVYNCDQVYRMKNILAVQNAKFLDESGARIRGLHVLSVIDLGYNGAFSFNPKYFSLSADGNTALLLFTHAGEVYYADKKTVAAAIKENELSELVLEDMTADFKTVDDLRNALGMDANPV